MQEPSAGRLSGSGERVFELGGWCKLKSVCSKPMVACQKRDRRFFPSPSRGRRYEKAKRRKYRNGCLLR